MHRPSPDSASTADNDSDDSNDSNDNNDSVDTARTNDVDTAVAERPARSRAAASPPRHVGDLPVPSASPAAARETHDAALLSTSELRRRLTETLDRESHLLREVDALVDEAAHFADMVQTLHTQLRERDLSAGALRAARARWRAVAVGSGLLHMLRRRR